MTAIVQELTKLKMIHAVYFMNLNC